LLEFPLLGAIQPAEFLHTAWMKPDKEVRAPGIVAQIRFFNKVSIG
jgi:hypothetical protein